MSDSLAARVAARREERVAKRSAKFVLTVPGFRDMLAARYRPLDFEDKRKIQLRYDGIGEDGAAEVNAAADLLVNACEELLEITGRDESGAPTYERVGIGWHPGVVRETFGLDDMPERTSQREALILALGSDAVMTHFGEYAQQADSILLEGEEAAQGEARPSAEG